MLAGMKWVGSPNKYQKGEKYMGQFLTAEEVGEIMGYSASHSYSIIRDLNAELKAKGYIVRNGRVPKKYFYERVGLDLEEGGNNGK